MGVTIHFEGKLKGPETFNELLQVAGDYARAMKWPTQPIEEDQVTLLRVRKEGEKEWDYTGPVRGLTLLPHEDCDPIRFEFDENFYIQEYTKTQFGGPEVHMWIVGLLRRVEPFFEQLNVFDEGEYWESSDMSVLKRHMDTCHQMIQQELQRCPHAAIKVKMPDGRIIDMMK
jgi:hypothetical protein